MSDVKVVLVESGAVSSAAARVASQIAAYREPGVIHAVVVVGGFTPVHPSSHAVWSPSGFSLVLEAYIANSHKREEYLFATQNEARENVQACARLFLLKHGGSDA